MQSILCLSVEKVKELQTALKEAQNGREVLRIVVILLRTQFSVDVLVKLLGLSRSCIYDRISRYCHRGTASFSDLPRSGRPSHLEQEKLDEVLAHIDSHSGVWSCQRIVSQLNLTVSSETLRRHLRTARYAFKRPKHIAPPSPDPQKAEKLALIESVKASLQPEDVLLYADESDFNLFSELRQSWQKKGEQKQIPTPGKNQRVYAFGAIDSYRASFVYRVFKRKRTSEFLLFLRQVVHRFEGQNIFMILDNYSVHKTKAVERFLERHPRLQLLFLPTYSPDENQPIERAWGTIKTWTTANQSFQDVDELMIATKSGLRRFQRHLKSSGAKL